MKKIIVIVIVIFVGLLFFLRDTDEPVKQETTFPVKRGDLEIEVTAYGTLQAKVSKQITSGLRGNYAITYLIDEGTKVKEGDILVKLEQKGIKERIEQLESQILSAEAEHKGKKAALEITISENQDKLEKAQLELKKASMKQEKHIKGDQPLKERDLKLKLQQTESAYKRQQENLKKMPKLLEEGYITQVEYEEEEIDLETKKTEYESAKLKHELYLKYDKPQEIKEKANEVKRQQNSLDRLKKMNQAAHDRAEAEFKKAERNLSNLKKEYGKQKEYLEKTIIKAPFPGIVIIGDPKRHWRRGSVQVGKSVWDNLVLITLPDLTEMEVMTNIHESEIDLVKEEQKATIVVEAAEGQSFKGKVVKVASVANANSWRTGDDVKEFLITIGLDKKNIGLRAGLSSEVTIHVETLKDVIYVPVYAVIREEEEYYCLIANNGQQEKRKVVPGKWSTEFVEITEGLEENEEVIVYEE
jgi:HlyD family secretion protein